MNQKPDMNIPRFYNEHKLLCQATLGVAIVGYCLGNLAGRLVIWLSQFFGTAAKTNEVGQEIFKQSKHNSTPVATDSTPPTDTSQEVSTNPIMEENPYYKAEIALRVSGGGLVGKNKARLLNDELKHWTLQNGEDIPAGENELLLNFMIFNKCEKFKEESSVCQPLIPASLFENKKEGSTIYFHYKKNLLQLTINQKIFGKGSFEELFKCAKKELLKDIDEGKYGFSGVVWAQPENPTEGYTLEHGGTLYQFNVNDQQQRLNKPEVQELVKLKDIQPSNYRSSQNKISGEYELKMVMCGKTNCVDIVLNEKFLCFYSQTSTIDVFTWQFLYIFPWKSIYKVPLQEMKEIVVNASYELKAGVLTVNLNNARCII